MRPAQVLATALAFSSLSAAWLDTLGEVKALGGFNALLYPRQDEGSSQTSASAKATGTEKSASATASESGSKETGAEASGSSSGTGKVTVSGSKTTTTGKPKTTVFDPRKPAGGVSMITPAAISGMQYYKIGDWVTFAWNYTSLSITPTAIDILATCTKNKATYTLAVNQSTEETGAITWDTGAFQTASPTKLLTETYTLLIYDSDSSVSAAAQAGYLAVYNQFSFGMYSPRSYTPWADFRCPTCNSGSMLSATERQTLGFLFLMSTITVLSFTWFANGFGIF